MTFVTGNQFEMELKIGQKNKAWFVRRSLERVRAKSQLDTVVTQEKYNTLHDYGAFLCSHPLYLFLSLSLSPDGMQK